MGDGFELSRGIDQDLRPDAAQVLLDTRNAIVAVQEPPIRVDDQGQVQIASSGLRVSRIGTEYDGFQDAAGVEERAQSSADLLQRSRRANCHVLMVSWN